MRRGLQWYKREPRAFLEACRAARMTERQVAVYAIILDLIYDHGGETPDDPRHIASYLSDVGTAGVRTAISQLIAMGKIYRVGDMLHQKRAENEAKTRENLSETRSVSGRLGGVSSGISRRQQRDNNGLAEANASSKTEPDKRREEKKEGEPNGSPKKTRASSLQAAVMNAAGGQGWSPEETAECAVIWMALGLTEAEIVATARAAAAESTTHPTGPRALDAAMSAAASEKRRPKPKADPKGTRLPEDWFLPRDWGRWAVDEGLTIPEVRAQAARFKDYWISLPAAKARKSDWIAVWRNWIRRVIDETKSKGGRNEQPHHGTGISQGRERPDPAIANIARLAGLGEASGHGGAGAGGSGEEAGPLRLGS